MGGRDIDILRPSAMTFVGTFDVSGSDRVKSRGGRDIYVRNALRSSSVVRYLWACGTEVVVVVVSATQGNGVFSARMKMCQSMFSYVQQSSVYALPNLALCLHCHQRMGYQSSS